MAVTLNLSADQLRLLRNASIHYREMLDKLPSSLVSEPSRIIVMEELSRAEVMLDNQLSPGSFSADKSGNYVGNYVRCSRCGRRCSNDVTEQLFVRAFVECPECIKSLR